MATDNILLEEWKERNTTLRQGYILLLTAATVTITISGIVSAVIFNPETVPIVKIGAASLELIYLFFLNWVLWYFRREVKLLCDRISKLENQLGLETFATGRPLLTVLYAAQFAALILIIACVILLLLLGFRII